MKPGLAVGKVYLIYGKKGAGKSVYLASCAFWSQKAGRPVFSNTEIVGCYVLPDQYWLYRFPERSVIIIDECALIHRNRDFKSFPKACGAWYKMIRKMNITVILSSQLDDVDKNLRSSADYVYRFTAKYGPLSIADVWVNTLVCQPAVDQNGKATGAAEIAMGLSKVPGIFRRYFFMWRPRYYDMFDTNEIFVDLIDITEKEQVLYERNEEQLPDDDRDSE